MSTSNKRFFDDDLFRQYFNCSSSSMKKRLCISLVPSVPQGGTNYTNKFNSISSDINLNSNNLLLYSKEITFDAVDKNNLTINIYADDQFRSSNNNSNIIKIESSSVHIIYPPIFNINNIPSVPTCHKQEIQIENVDRKIEATFEI